jgi:hypothetical protein
MDGHGETSIPPYNFVAGGIIKKVYKKQHNLDFCVQIKSMIQGWFMVFNATFNNISVISWQSFLLVEETGVPGENHRPVASH